MKMKLLATSLCAAALAFASGCASNSAAPSEPLSDAARASVSAVVIGVENSKFAGSCPGAAYDSRRIASLLGYYASNVTYLTDANATRSSVSAALKKAVQSDLCILYYSGHGGSDRFSDTGAEEDDGQDEYLCLYDTYMRDNEIWDIISKAKGRVFLMFDCCHSKTMFQTPSFTMRRAVAAACPCGASCTCGANCKCEVGKPCKCANGASCKVFKARSADCACGAVCVCDPCKCVKGEPCKCGAKSASCKVKTAKRSVRFAAPRSSEFSMLCWSGCPDDTYSYGSASGGEFTNALFRHFSSDRTYAALWAEIAADKDLKEYEEVQKTEIGTGFNDKLILR